jgi:hypothetical protein
MVTLDGRPSFAGDPMRILTTFALVAALVAGPALAQSGGDMFGGIGATPEAVAATARPGDEAMTCEQIGGEIAPYSQRLYQLMNDSGVLQDAQDAQAAMQRGGQPNMGGQMAMGLGMGLLGMIPGGGLLAMGMQQGQQAQMQRQADQGRSLQQRRQGNAQTFMADMQTYLRENPRFQRLAMLAEAKRCGQEPAPRGEN